MSIGTSWQSVSAEAVALRGSASTNAISPRISPGPSRSSNCPMQRSSTVPDFTTYMQLPGSPSPNTLAPATYVLKLSAYLYSRRDVFLEDIADLRCSPVLKLVLPLQR